MEVSLVCCATVANVRGIPEIVILLAARSYGNILQLLTYKAAGCAVLLTAGLGFGAWVGGRASVVWQLSWLPCASNFVSSELVIAFHTYV